MIVRGCQSDDIPSVLALASAVFARVNEEEIRYWIRQGHAWVVAEDVHDEILGFLVAVERHVRLVVVHPDHRRRGAATSLFAVAHRFFAGTPLRITTRVGNPAQKLYFDLGYRVEKVVADAYVGPNEDGLQMVRKG